MELKSLTIKEFFIKEYCKNNCIDTNYLSENFELVIDGKNIQKRYYKEEIPKVKEDLLNLSEKIIKSITIKNINIEESEEMNSIMKQVGHNTQKLKIENSNIGNLDLYMSAISGRKGKNYTLSDTQYIKEFEYNKENEMLVIAAENLDILSEINRYKKPKMLKIKVYDKKELQSIVKYIDVIRKMKLSRNILVDNCKENLSEIYQYENYINEKVVIFQSELIRASLGLDKLPTKKTNQTIYNLIIDGSKVDNSYIYVLEGEQEELFIKDMEEISKYINIGNIEYKNIVFADKYEIKQILNEIESRVCPKEVLEEHCIVVKRSLFDIIKEKVGKLFNLNYRINKNQKAFPIYNEKM